MLLCKSVAPLTVSRYCVTRTPQLCNHIHVYLENVSVLCNHVHVWLGNVSVLCNLQISDRDRIVEDILHTLLNITSGILYHQQLLE